MNILLLTHTFSNKTIGGEARIGWELAQALALADQNNKIIIVSSFVENDINNLPKNLKVFQVPFCHPAPSMDKSNMLRIFFYSLPLIFLHKIDVIHVISSNSPCPFARFKFGKKFVESADICHDYENPKIKAELWHDRKHKSEANKIIYRPGILEKIFDKFTKYFFIVFRLNQIYPEGTDAFACRTKSLIEQLKNNGSTARLEYIPNGVDPKKFIPQIINKNGDDFTFLFVGKLTKTKGLTYLFNAFKRLRANNKSIRLLLIGSGAPSTVKELHEQAVGTEGLEFLGEKNPEEIKDYYKLCDCFILPSLSEGFGIVNLEAMASGKAVISTKVGGIRDVVINGETGLLVDPADSDQLYQAMKNVSDNRETTKLMGRKGCQRAIDTFSWNIIAVNLLNLYKNLCQK